MRHWDVMVAGAGPAGAVTALSLARTGRKVALCDPRLAEPPLRKIGESLPGAARKLLRHLDLFAVVEKGHLPHYGNAFVWGSDEPAHTDFLLDPNGLGWHLDRVAFEKALQQAASHAEVDVLPWRVEELRRNGGLWEVTVGAAEEKLTASYVVDATGRAARLARRLGATPHADDDLIALYQWWQPRADDLDQRTWVEATENGWWYSSRVPRGGGYERVVAFHTDADQVAAFVKDASRWDRELAATRQIGSFLPGAIPLSDRESTQAWGGSLDKLGGPGWLATGDAALSFDPLSSQGIYNALYCGMKAAQAIEQELNGRDGLTAYRDRLQSIRRAYLRAHQEIYSQETRFPDSAFWQRRGALGARLARSR